MKKLPKIVFILITICCLQSCSNKIVQNAIDKNITYYPTIEAAVEKAKKDMIEIAQITGNKSYDTSLLKMSFYKPTLIAPITVLEKNKVNDVLKAVNINFLNSSKKTYLVPFIYANNVVATTEVAHTSNGWTILQNNELVKLTDMKNLIQLNPEIVNAVSVYLNNDKNNKYSLSLLPTILLTSTNENPIYNIFPIVSNTNFANFTIDSVSKAVESFNNINKEVIKYSKNNDILELSNMFYYKQNGNLNLIHSKDSSILIIKDLLDKIIK